MRDVIDAVLVGIIAGLVIGMMVYVDQGLVAAVVAGFMAFLGAAGFTLAILNEVKKNYSHKQR